MKLFFLLVSLLCTDEGILKLERAFAPEPPFGTKFLKLPKDEPRCVEIHLGNPKETWEVTVLASDDGYFYLLVRDLSRGIKSVWKRFGEFAEVERSISYGEKRVPYRILLRAGGGSPPLWLELASPEYRRGSLKILGKCFAFGLYDSNFDGDFSDPETYLVLDLNEDGKFDTSEYSLELIPATKPFGVGNACYRVKPSPCGYEIELLKVEPTEDAVYLIIEGFPSPDFEAVDINGRKVRFSELEGKVILLDFWATWCRPYINEMPNIVSLYGEYKDRGLEVIGISLDTDIENVKSYVQEMGLKHTLIFDECGLKGRLAKLYRVRGIPSIFLIGRDGRLFAKGYYLRGRMLKMAVKLALESPGFDEFHREWKDLEKEINEIMRLLEIGKEDEARKLAKEIPEVEDIPWIQQLLKKED
ncbi:MAG: redoxin domain-containing protein [bacterium]|nr:redoxin domain-containing protein [bacterium]